jgi:hypothetical protein
MMKGQSGTNRARGLLGAAAMALVLAGCATSGSTPYQPASSANAVQGGYSEVRLTEDRYSVTFAGNRLTSREQVEAFLLYRAAELTVQQGSDWFVILDKETERQVEREVRRDPLYNPWFHQDYFYWRPYWRYYGPRAGWRTWNPYFGDPFWANRVDVQTVERYEATAEIRCGKGAMPVEGRAFNAREVIARLGPKVQPPNP